MDDEEEGATEITDGLDIDDLTISEIDEIIEEEQARVGEPV